MNSVTHTPQQLVAVVHQLAVCQPTRVSIEEDAESRGVEVSRSTWRLAWPCSALRGSCRASQPFSSNPSGSWCSGRAGGRLSLATAPACGGCSPHGPTLGTLWTYASRWCLTSPLQGPAAAAAGSDPDAGLGSDPLSVAGRCSRCRNLVPG